MGKVSLMSFQTGLQGILWQQLRENPRQDNKGKFDVDMSKLQKDHRFYDIVKANDGNEPLEKQLILGYGLLDVHPKRIISSPKMRKQDRRHPLCMTHTG